MNGEAFRRHGHDLVDWIADYLEHSDRYPVLARVKPGEIASAFPSHAPEEPESFDKEYLRRWLVTQGFRGDGPLPQIPEEIRIEASRRYIAACQLVQGTPFVPNLEPPTERLVRNLKAKTRR